MTEPLVRLHFLLGSFQVAERDAYTHLSHCPPPHALDPKSLPAMYQKMMTKQQDLQMVLGAGFRGLGSRCNVIEQQGSMLEACLFSLLLTGVLLW